VKLNRIVLVLNSVLTLLLLLAVVHNKNTHRDDLSLYAQGVTQKMSRTKNLARLAVFNTYCNNYQHRALGYYVRNGKWDDYVMFPPICNIQDALEVEDALKYRNWKPTDKHVYHSYDGYYTGKGHDGKDVDKAHKEHLKEIRKRVSKLLKELK